MTHSKFGGSYLPGCSGPPDEPDPPPESVEVWDILEEAGVDEAVIERVCEVVERLAISASSECPRCLDLAVAQAEADARAFKEPTP